MNCKRHEIDKGILNQLKSRAYFVVWAQGHPSMEGFMHPSDVSVVFLLSVNHISKERDGNAVKRGAYFELKAIQSNPKES